MARRRRPRCRVAERVRTESGKSIGEPDRPAPAPGDRVEDYLGFKDVSVGLRFGDPSRFQGIHKGVDLWDESNSSSRKIALGNGRIVEVRDGNSDGYTSCLQVEYLTGPLAGYVEQIGHIARGSSKTWRKGQAFDVGDLLCVCGTASDGKGIRHFHVEYFDDVAAALAYDHSKAIDPARIRKMIGERDLYRRPSAFGGGTALAVDALSEDEAARLDICRGIAHE